MGAIVFMPIEAVPSPQPIDEQGFDVGLELGQTRPGPARSTRRDSIATRRDRQDWDRRPRFFPPDSPQEKNAMLMGISSDSHCASEIAYWARNSTSCGTRRNLACPAPKRESSTVRRRKAIAGFPFRQDVDGRGPIGRHRARSVRRARGDARIVEAHGTTVANWLRQSSAPGPSHS